LEQAVVLLLVRRLKQRTLPLVEGDEAVEREAAADTGGTAPARPVASVQIGTPTVKGPVDKEIVLRILRRHENETKFCYEKELMRQPDLGGEVSIRFTISPAGAVTESATERSTTHADSMDQCVADAVRRWEFPKAGKATVVSYPVILKASKAQ
jgi:TonB family protein